MIKVILTENVAELGKTGDVVRVSEGYARNFLLPRKLCVLADEKNTHAMEHHKKEMDRKKEKDIKNAQVLAAKLSTFSCTISKKAGEQDKIFGSVTTADIATVLSKGGFSVDKKQIHMNEPIKHLGVFSVPVRLHSEVTAAVKVWVVAEK